MSNDQKFPKLVPLPQKKQSKAKTLIAAILFFVITPLVIFARCSSNDEVIKVEELPLAPATHQKIFIDPAGEKTVPPVKAPESSKHSKATAPAKKADVP